MDLRRIFAVIFGNTAVFGPVFNDALADWKSQAINAALALGLSLIAFLKGRVDSLLMLAEDELNEWAGDNGVPSEGGANEPV